MLKGLFTRRGIGRRKQSPIDYEEQRRRVQAVDPKVRSDLAGRTDTRPEILYYLAEDSASEVREAVARNQATPVQADVILSRDSDGEVRAGLADKIARLVPDMPDDEQAKVRELTISVLETLAADHLAQVRAIVAEHLKHADNVPPAVIRRLAQDVESMVATPVLQYSPLLNDQDLLEIIRITEAEGAVAAIARRSTVAADVADAIAASDDTDAVTALLGNDNAQIREETLDRLIDKAAEVEPWHAPLVKRPQLSTQAVRRIAGFVAASLVAALAARNDLDAATAEELAEQVRKSSRTDDNEDDATSDEAPAERAKRLHRDDKLDDETVAAAVGNGDRSFAVEALALLSDLPTATVNKMIDLGDAKAATALVWKAGLGMRLAMEVQKRLAKIPPQQILNARNGTDYPLTESELQAQIELLS